MSLPPKQNYLAVRRRSLDTFNRTRRFPKADGPLSNFYTRITKNVFFSNNFFISYARADLSTGISQPAQVSPDRRALRVCNLRVTGANGGAGRPSARYPGVNDTVKPATAAVARIPSKQTHLRPAAATV